MVGEGRPLCTRRLAPPPPHAAATLLVAHARTHLSHHLLRVVHRHRVRRPLGAQVFGVFCVIQSYNDGGGGVERAGAAVRRVNKGKGKRRAEARALGVTGGQGAAGGRANGRR